MSASNVSKQTNNKALARLRRDKPDLLHNQLSNIDWAENLNSARRLRSTDRPQLFKMQVPLGASLNQQQFIFNEFVTEICYTQPHGNHSHWHCLLLVLDISSMFNVFNVNIFVMLYYIIVNIAPFYSVNTFPSLRRLGGYNFQGVLQKWDRWQECNMLHGVMYTRGDTRWDLSSGWRCRLAGFYRKIKYPRVHLRSSSVAIAKCGCYTLLTAEIDKHSSLTLSHQQK